MRERWRRDIHRGRREASKVSLYLHTLLFFHSRHDLRVRCGVAAINSWCALYRPDPPLSYRVAVWVEARVRSHVLDSVVPMRDCDPFTCFCVAQICTPRERNCAGMCAFTVQMDLRLIRAREFQDKRMHVDSKSAFSSSTILHAVDPHATPTPTGVGRTRSQAVGHYVDVRIF